MKLHTDFAPDTLPHPIGLQSQIVTLGSCFADAIGSRLANHKLTVLNNPFGTIFNPISITKLLTMALQGQHPDENAYLERDGIWFHYDFHSSHWAPSREELQNKLVNILDQTAKAVRQADFLLLTLGSAIVYRRVETDKVVANCHKMPGQLFEKYLYAYEHLRDEMARLLNMLHKVNPRLTLVLTVSPVRHTRDTLPLNSVSKSMLRMLTHDLSSWYNWVQYFPAYELMMDDLRDYRFYEADLIHPNTQAEDYIFEKFAASAFDSALKQFLPEWAQLRKSLAHRPLYGDTSPAHRQFLTTLATQLQALSNRIDVSAELADVRGRLEKCEMHTVQ